MQGYNANGEVRFEEATSFLFSTATFRRGVPPSFLFSTAAVGEGFSPPSSFRQRRFEEGSPSSLLFLAATARGGGTPHPSSFRRATVQGGLPLLPSLFDGDGVSWRGSHIFSMATFRGGFPPPSSFRRRVGDVSRRGSPSLLFSTVTVCGGLPRLPSLFGGDVFRKGSGDVSRRGSPTSFLFSTATFRPSS